MKSLLFFCLLCATICQAQQTVNWTYPIVPGSNEWKEFQSHQEMVDACQIPENVLASIDTESLVHLCLNYPLLFDIYAYNQVSDGFDAFYNQFNGIQELLRRQNAIDVLLVLYQSKLQQQSSMLDNQIVSLLEKGKYKFEVSAIELFMGCPQIQPILSDQKLSEVITALMNGYEEKCKCLSENKKLAFQSNVYARANIINKINPSLLSNQRMKQLLKGVGQDAEPVEQLNTLTYKLIQK